MDMISKQASYFKRICSAFIDFCIIAVVYIILTFISTSVLNNTIGYGTLKQECNDIIVDVYNLAEEHGLGEYDEEKEEFVFKEGIEEDSQEFQDFLELDEVLTKYELLNSKTRKIQVIQFGKFLVEALIVELIFCLIIPLARKDHASIGMIIMKLSVINRGDYKASKFQIVMRFLAMYLIETVFYYMFFGELLILVMPLVNLGFMCFNRHNITLHDFFANTKVIEEDVSVYFESLEERNEYYTQKAKEDLEYQRRKEMGN